MHVTMPELAFFFITLPFSLWAAWTDLSGMRISNRMNILLFCTFLVSGLILLPPAELGLRIGVAFAALGLELVAVEGVREDERGGLAVGRSTPIVVSTFGGRWAAAPVLIGVIPGHGSGCRAARSSSGRPSSICRATAASGAGNSSG